MRSAGLRGIIDLIVKNGTKLPARPIEQEPAPIWTRQDEERRLYVRDMFVAIAPRYDFLNSVLSFRLHHVWRRHAVRLARLRPGDVALDVCAGTGDFAFELARAVGNTGQVYAVDFCEPMLRIGKQKAMKQNKPSIRWILADALALPFSNDTFDAVTIGFGIRNLIDKPAAFREMVRVLKPGGRVICLELNRPRNPLVKPFYDFYTLHLLPKIGGLFSKQDAYVYLPNSIQHFVEREQLACYLSEAGFQNVRYQDLSLGVVCIHQGVKPCLS
jgi:demethylmenaquinone methyltransferase/2-methoxy-6-polyprenyl-1,4-benzoquinol methylase